MNRRARVVVVGASGFGRETLDVLAAIQLTKLDLTVLGVLDDHPSDINLSRLSQRDIAYLGPIAPWSNRLTEATHFTVAIGNPSTRRRLATRLMDQGLKPYTAIHPQSIVGSRSTIGEGSIICAGVVVSTNVSIGPFAHLNPQATVGHDANLDSYVSVNPGAVISGEVSIGSETLIGASATVLQNLAIGRGVTVGASALVTKSVPPHSVVKGVPGTW